MKQAPDGGRPQFVECGPPYSFYFDLVESHWKAKSCGSNPLHRLATLARKQGALAIVVEDASGSPCVQQEVEGLEQASKGGETEALRLSFLSELPTGNDIASVGEQALIGQCTLINHRRPGEAEFATSFIFEAFFATPSIGPKRKLLNNFINCQATFQVAVDGRPFEIRGLYYAQQNGITSVCAHACIRMAVRTLFPDRDPPSTKTINALIGHAPPLDGMLPEQIEQILTELTGREVKLWKCEPNPALRLEAQEPAEPGVVKPLGPGEYLSVLMSAADSGDVTLLSFETGPVPGADQAANPVNHVVVNYGYTFNSDEWHPQALPEYSGAEQAKHSPASAWVDHLVIHDDNFGPYLALSSRALENHGVVKADWIITIRGLRSNFEAHAAEATGAVILPYVREQLSEDATENRWLDYLLRYKKPLVMRAVLLTRDQYCEHLVETEAHDGSRATAKHVLNITKELPETLWMVEFTLPDLMTGNHSKLGEVILVADRDADRTPGFDLVKAVRVPSRFVIVRDDGAALSILKFPITSHSKIYQIDPPDEIW